MAQPQPDPAELKALQDAIYRDKVLRAREMTKEERFAEGLELTNGMFLRLLAGAMWQLETEDEDKGWTEVRRRLDVIGRVHDEGRFATNRPANA